MPRSRRSPLAHVLADLDAALARVGARWYLFGARAAQLRGARRATVDVDVTVFDTADSEQLLSAMRRRFALRVPDAAGFLAATRVLPLVHTATSIPVDAVLGGPGLEEYFLSRASAIEHGGVSVLVPCAQDLVVMKVLAARDHDIGDAVEMIAFDPGAVDFEAMRELLDDIGRSIGDAGMLEAFARLQQALVSSGVVLNPQRPRVATPADMSDAPAVPRPRRRRGR